MDSGISLFAWLRRSIHCLTDPTKLGKPENYEITVRDVRLSAGAGFVVAYTGDIMTMPGLPKKPAAYNIDCDNEGNIYGLF